MSKAALGWTDYASDDTSGVAVSGSGFDSHAIDSAYPALRCLNDRPSDVTQVDYDVSTSQATSTLTADWGSAQTVRIAAAINCRFSSDVVSVKARAVSTGGSTLATGTTYTYAQLDPLQGETDRYDLFWIFSSAVSAGKVALDIVLNANAQGYYEIGRLWCGPALVWDGGTGVDWEMGAIDRSIVTELHGGGIAVHSLPICKEMYLTKRGLSYVDAMGDPDSTSSLSLRRFMLEAGESNPVVAISTDLNAHRAQTMSAFCRVIQMPRLSHIGVSRFNTELRVRQLR